MLFLGPTDLWLDRSWAAAIKDKLRLPVAQAVNASSCDGTSQSNPMLHARIGDQQTCIKHTTVVTAQVITAKKVGVQKQNTACDVFTQQKAAFVLLCTPYIIHWESNTLLLSGWLTAQARSSYHMIEYSKPWHASLSEVCTVMQPHICK